MARRPLAVALAAIAVVFTGAPVAAQAAVDATGRTGEVRFVKRMTPSDDKYVTSGLQSDRDWLNQKFWRTEVFTPFFDSRTSWYGRGWLYSDIYAIYKGGDIATKHPEWILKDSAGNKLFIPWGCGGGTCPQYAADITNPDYRAFWINQLKTNLAKGYKGAWIDDVNTERRVGNGNGTEIAPYSPSLGRFMSVGDWRKAMADFTEQVRREVPNHELLHNSIWYAGGDVGRHSNADIQRQINSADYINVERGVTDGGLTGGTAEWSLRRLFDYIGFVQGKGKGVIIDSSEQTNEAREYSLASYFLINTGKDGVGDMSQTKDSWWKGWDADLGTAKTNRFDWQGLMRRDFTGGIALVNEPGAPTRTVNLPTAMRTVDGRTVTSVTLGASRAAVLFGDAGTPPSGAPTAPSTGTPTPTPPAPTPTTPPTGCNCSTPTPTTPAPTTPTTPAPTTPQPTTPAPSTETCQKVRITYPTLRWDSKRGRFVARTAATTVCLPKALKAGTKAHKAALKKAKKQARKASLKKAKAARAKAARAEAARKRA